MNNGRGFLDRYNIHRKTEDSDETILRDKQSGEFVLMKQVMLFTPEQFRKVVETLEAQKQLKHDHLLSLLDYEIMSSYSNDSGMHHKIITFFQYSSHNLEQQIDARFQQNRLFDEPELWNILMSCVLGLAYLQKESVGHGCISPIDIFITKDGVVHVVDPSIASAEPFQIQQGYYYSPQLLEYTKQQGQRPTEHLQIFRSDVFSLGICMLHAAMLQSADDCYSYQQCEIDYDELQKKINLVNDHYSPEFVNALIYMLKEDAAERPDFIELEQYLNELMDGDQSLSHSRNSMTNSYGIGVSTVSRLSYHQTKHIQPASPLVCDTTDTQISEKTGMPHSQTFEICVIDEGQQQQHNNIDAFNRLVQVNQSNRIFTPKTINNGYTVQNIPLQYPIAEKYEQQSSSYPHEQQYVQRTIQIDYIPQEQSRSNKHKNIFPQPSSISRQPQNSSGSSFGPVYYDNPSSKSIFQLNESYVNPHHNSGHLNNQIPNESSIQLDEPAIQPLEFTSFSQYRFDKSHQRSRNDDSNYPIGNQLYSTIANPIQSSYPKGQYSYEGSSKENLFTDPMLLDMVRQDVNKIMSKARNKENLPAN